MDAALLCRELAGFAAATIYEALGKAGDVAPHIQGIVPGARITGVAFTVKSPIGQSQGLAQAVDVAPAGSVIVVDVDDTALATGWGGSASLAAHRRGIAGALTNGAARDIEQIRSVGMPVFAAGATVRGAYRSEAAELQVPVAIGGAVIAPGDIVVGDSDGVVVVSQRAFETILECVRARDARETEIDRRIAAGMSYAEATRG